MPRKKISLFQCGEARWLDSEKIYCHKGYWLGSKKDGVVNTLRQARGEPLIFAVCQKCPDLDYFGASIPSEERGWIHF